MRTQTVARNTDDDASGGLKFGVKIAELLGLRGAARRAVFRVEIDDNAFKSIEAIITSMTPGERANPALLNGGRRKRIASGSGTDIQEVNRLIKQFDETRKMMKMMSGGKGSKLLQSMGNMKRR